MDNETTPWEEKHHYTDLGNAKRLAEGHRDSLCYVQGRGWLAWDGKRWKASSDQPVWAAAKDTVRSMEREALQIEDDDKRRDMLKHCVRSESWQGMHGMVMLAQRELEVAPDRFDTDPWLLNLNNGTIDLRTGQKHDHTPTDYITRLSPVDYPEAVDPEQVAVWDKFLHDITCGDEGPADYLQRAAGLSLTGVNPEECFFTCWGSGGNGKSKFLGVLQHTLGEYATVIEPETILSKKWERGGPSPDVAKLEGMRLVVTSEPNKQGSLDMARIKRFTGNDKISAAFKYQNEREFLPVFKLWFMTNHQPHIDDSTEGAWRRIKLVPFLAQFTTPDTSMGDKLKQAAPAFLAWAIQGCLLWQGKGGQAGIPVPDLMRQYLAAYKAEQAPVAAFLDENYTRMPANRVDAADLFKEFNQWLDTKEFYWDAKNFREALVEYGCEVKRSHGVYWCHGIARKQAEEPTLLRTPPKEAPTRGTLSRNEPTPEQREALREAGWTEAQIQAEVEANPYRNRVGWNRKLVEGAA